MLKENRIKILNYSFLIIAVILSFGGVSTCCLSYGHGLGDILYLFPLWLLTFIYFILVVFLKRKIKESVFVPIIFGIILSFFNCRNGRKFRHQLSQEQMFNKNFDANSNKN